jgi:hypothetical protein
MGFIEDVENILSNTPERIRPPFCYLARADRRLADKYARPASVTIQREQVTAR